VRQADVVQLPSSLVAVHW